jgi:hypothetical protein
LDHRPQSITKSFAKGLSDDRALRVAVVRNRGVETIKSGIETVGSRSGVDIETVST